MGITFRTRQRERQSALTDTEKHPVNHVLGPLPYGLGILVHPNRMESSTKRRVPRLPFPAVVWSAASRSVGLARSAEPCPQVETAGWFLRLSHDASTPEGPRYARLLRNPLEHHGPVCSLLSLSPRYARCLRPFELLCSIIRNNFKATRLRCGTNRLTNSSLSLRPARRFPSPQHSTRIPRKPTGS